ncbi:hypothetical protein PYCCODRAFT_1429341 [Trametes coccinea BRFM310]|uniref:Uncharacterized protein n=1 Tax=Trametes coccinea (strain BRFM310) TaxID=1353009 RepID=A0A1Y2J5U1_TRAC3|nr:hypothetical protein PYCCODRAFT_1429341 [Trametes coccinea BRFM310]
MSAPVVEVLSDTMQPTTNIPFFKRTELPSELWGAGYEKELPIMCYGFIIPGAEETVRCRVKELGLDTMSTVADNDPAAVTIVLCQLRKPIRKFCPAASWASVFHDDCKTRDLCLALCTNEPSQVEENNWLLSSPRGDKAAKKAREVLGLPDDVEPRWYFARYGGGARKRSIAEYMRRASAPVGV